MLVCRAIKLVTGREIWKELVEMDAVVVRIVDTWRIYCTDSRLSSVIFVFRHVNSTNGDTALAGSLLDPSSRTVRGAVWLCNHADCYSQSGERMPRDGVQSLGDRSVPCPGIHRGLKRSYLIIMRMQANLVRPPSYLTIPLAARHQLATLSSFRLFCYL